VGCGALNSTHSPPWRHKLGHAQNISCQLIIFNCFFFSQTIVEKVHFRHKTSSATKKEINFVPLTSLFLSPSRISVTHLASPGVHLDAPDERNAAPPPSARRVTTASAQPRQQNTKHVNFYADWSQLQCPPARLAASDECFPWENEPTVSRHRPITDVPLATELPILSYTKPWNCQLSGGHPSMPVAAADAIWNALPDNVVSSSSAEVIPTSPQNVTFPAILLRLSALHWTLYTTT